MKKPFEQIFVEPIVHPVKHRVAEPYLKTPDQIYLSDTSPVAVVVRELAYASHTGDQKLLIAVMRKYRGLLNKAFGVSEDGSLQLDSFMAECEKKLPDDVFPSYADGGIRIGDFFKDNLRGYVLEKHPDFSSSSPLEPMSYLSMKPENLSSSLILAQRPMRDDDGKPFGKKYGISEIIPLAVKAKERPLRQRVEMSMKKIPRRKKQMTFP